MCRFQVRRRQKAHRALCKKAPAHPQRGRQGRDGSPPKNRAASFWGSFYSLSHGVGLNNPSVLPSASHLPLHRGGYIAGFPKRFFEEKEFLGERARKRFLDKAPVGLCPLSSLETAHGACRFLTERGFYRARTAGVISVAFAVRRMPAKGAVNGVPKKDLRSKDFLGKGGTDVISVAFAVRRMPAKGVVFRRGAADRPRTDTPFGTGS